MEYKKCNHCQSSLIIRKSFTITTLKGNKINVNGDMYCGKDCFLSHKFIKNGMLKSSPKSDTSQNKQKNKLLGELIIEEMERSN